MIFVRIDSQKLELVIKFWKPWIKDIHIPYPSPPILGSQKREPPTIDPNTPPMSFMDCFSKWNRNKIYWQF
jgi:hypothetical protein